MGIFDAITKPFAGGGLFGGGIMSGGGGGSYGGNDDAVMNLGLGLLSGKNNSEAFENALTGFSAGRRTDMLREQARQEQIEKDREAAQIAQIAKSLGMEGTADPQTVRSLFLAKHKPRETGFEERLYNSATPEEQEAFRQNKLGVTTDKIRQFQFAKKDGYQGSFADWMNEHGSRTGSGGFGLTPLYGEDETTGEIVPLQLSRDGGFHQPQLPPNIKLRSGVDKIDLGDRFGLLDKRTGQIVGYEPKNLRGEESQKAQGKAEGEAIAGSGNALDMASTTLGLIRELKTHPGRAQATGGSRMFPLHLAPGTDAYNFDVRRKQIAGRTFLEAFQALKGGGAITEAEGRKATDALARLDAGQSDAEFERALNDLEEIVTMGMNRIRARGGSTPNASAPATPSREDLRRKYGL